MHSIGLDIGGTKIAGILIDDSGKSLAQIVKPTPDEYPSFLAVCNDLVKDLTKECNDIPTLGVGVPGVVDQITGQTPFVCNVPYLSGQGLRYDLEKIFQRRVHLANDAGCAALSEAMDGAACNYKDVFGVIIGTGVGGGLVSQRRLIEGANGITGEFGHLPLPFREEADGPSILCNCGQFGCIDKTIGGGALERLYFCRYGDQKSASQIAELALKQDHLALTTLDSFYTTVAKAMVTIIHAYDPEVIVLSGGLSQLPNLYEAVVTRWEKYCLLRRGINTKLLPALHGTMTGLRGAAWLGKNYI